MSVMGLEPQSYYFSYVTRQRPNREISIGTYTFIVLNFNPELFYLVYIYVTQNHCIMVL